MPELDLENQEIFNEMKKQADEALLNADVKSAYIFVRNMSKMVTPNSDFFEGYQGMISILSFVCLQSLSNDEVVELFKSKMLFALVEDDIDIQRKLHSKFITIPPFSKRDDLRKQIREALLENIERIGEIDFFVINKKVNSTIGNWLKKYNSLLGVGSIESVEQSQFFTTDKDVKSISQTEQKLLRKLINAYEYLKLSSQSPEGLEEPVMFNIDGDRKVLKQGKWDDVKLPINIKKIVNNLFPKEEEESKPTAYSAQEILVETKNILKETSAQPDKIIDNLNDYIQKGILNSSLGALLLLAQLRKLDTILSDRKDMSLIIVEDLNKKGQDANVDGFKINPNAPQYLARFLKIVLEDKLKLSQNDAIAFGKKLSQVLAMEGEKYANIVKNNKWNL